MKNDIPEYVRKNLDYYLSKEPEDPETYGALILDLSNRWGI